VLQKDSVAIRRGPKVENREISSTQVLISHADRHLSNVREGGLIPMLHRLLRRKDYGGGGVNWGERVRKGDLIL